jgi:hypothetical protein
MSCRSSRQERTPRFTWKPVEKTSGLAARELRECVPELDVDVERAVEQARPRDSGAVHRERDGGRVLHLGMVREAEVVVRPEHHELAVAAQHDRVLGRRKRPVVGINPSCARIDYARPDLAALREDVHSPFTHRRRSTRRL